MGYPARLERLADQETAQGKSGDALLRLAAFAVQTVEDADRLRERLAPLERRISRALPTRRARSRRCTAARRRRRSRICARCCFCAARARPPTRWRWPRRRAPLRRMIRDWLEAARYLDETPAPAVPDQGRGPHRARRGARPELGDGAENAAGEMDQRRLSPRSAVVCSLWRMRWGEGRELSLPSVMAGLEPAIHAKTLRGGKTKSWMAATSVAMTANRPPPSPAFRKPPAPAPACRS